MKATYDPEKKETTYTCLHGHAHAHATTAILCEQAPRLDVRHEHRLDELGYRREWYLCKRCGGSSQSAFLDLATIENRQAGHQWATEPGTQVGRVQKETDDLYILAKWRTEAKTFHEKHTGCNTETTT